MTKPKSKVIDQEYFETLIACNLLSNKEYVGTTIEHFLPEHFQDKSVRLVVDIVKDFYEKRKDIPTLTELKLYLADEEDRKDFKELVGKFKAVDTKFNFDELIENTENFIKERSVYNAVRKTINAYSENEIDTTETLKLFENACNIKLVQNFGFDYFNQLQDHVDYLKRVDKHISTGFAWLDSMLGGGLMEDGRAMYLFLGPTNIGKSIVLGNIAANIAIQGKTTFLITLEMPEQVYGRRISSKFSQIKYKDLADRSDDFLDLMNSVRVKNPEARLIIKEFAPSTLTVESLAGYLQKAEKNGLKPDAIVLDYIGLMKPSRGDNSKEKFQAVAEGLRALTYQFNCPLVTAHQSTRGSYKEMPGLDDTGDSIGIPQTVDAQFSLFQDEGDDELGIIKCALLKSRFGRKFGKTQFKVDYDTLTMHEEEVYFEEDSKNNLEDLLNKIKK